MDNIRSLNQVISHNVLLLVIFLPGFVHLKINFEEF